MYYLIENTLKECSSIPAKESEKPYVAILTPEQWAPIYSPLLNYAYYSLGNRARRFCSTASFNSTSCFSSLISGLASSSR